MSDMTDKVKGKTKEAVGAAKDDENLQNEGKQDRVKGEAGEKAKQEVKDTVDRHRERGQ
jgi:uncharacterized protein YjbJ (UPF0337 family)